jgi:hypothetical protein
LATFFLLALLALMMRLLILLFPEKQKHADAPVYAAIAATYRSMYPGARVSSIEEKK